MANTPLPGYPNYYGAKYHETFDHTGPTSYSQATGDVILASDLGMGGFDWANVMAGRVYSISGTYFGIAVAVGSGAAQGSLVIHWYVTASLAEVNNAVDLHAESMRITADMV
jgi:hypothetical protein